MSSSSAPSSAGQKKIDGAFKKVHSWDSHSLPPFVVGGREYKGYMDRKLKKGGASLVAGWKRSYFATHGLYFLNYYGDQTMLKQKAQVDLRRVVSVDLDPSNRTRIDIVFAGDQGKLQLRTENDKLAKEWHEVLTSKIDEINKSDFELKTGMLQQKVSSLDSTHTNKWEQRYFGFQGNNWFKGYKGRSQDSKLVLQVNLAGMNSADMDKSGAPQFSLSGADGEYRFKCATRAEAQSWVDALMNRIAVVNPPKISFKKSDSKEQSIHSLIRWNKDTTIDSIKARLDAGQDVNEKDQHGNTPMHIAAQNGHLHIVQFLLKQPGIEVNAQNGKGHTSLHMAVQYKLKRMNIF